MARLSLVGNTYTFSLLNDPLFSRIYSCLYIPLYRSNLMGNMKKKTSIVVDADLWRRWVNFVVSIHGSTRRISSEIEKALLEYMSKGSNRISANELRKKLGIRKTTMELNIPKDLEERIVKSRKKRVKRT